MILAAFNREQNKSVNVLTFQVPPSRSVQEPGFATSFKNGYASAGSRPIKDGYTNLNGRIAYWLAGEKNIAGNHASALSYLLCDGGGTLYQLHIESLGTNPLDDKELLTISASFKIHGKTAILPKATSPANSLAFQIGIIIGFLAVLILLAPRIFPKLKKR
jgi:hypothetical protein